MNALRVLITEDHASTRLGIMEILRHGFPSLRFGEAGDEASTWAQLEAEEWDVLILDISLPGRSGVELLPEIKRRYPRLPVLIYSAHREEDFALHMLRAGAKGYLTKERAPEELCLATRQILAGGSYLSPLMVQRLVKPARKAAPGRPHEGLSSREFQVLRLLAQGQTGKEAAAELGLSQKTISTYRAHILKKLHMRGTAELVKYAVQERLV